MMVLIQSPATPVEHLVALAMVGRTVRDLLRSGGMTEAEVDAVAVEALHLSLQYAVSIELKR